MSQDAAGVIESLVEEATRRMLAGWIPEALAWCRKHQAKRVLIVSPIAAEILQSMQKEIASELELQIWVPPGYETLEDTEFLGGIISGDAAALLERIPRKIDTIVVFEFLQNLEPQELHKWLWAFKQYGARNLFFKIGKWRIKPEQEMICHRHPYWWAQVLGEYFKVRETRHDSDDEVPTCTIFAAPGQSTQYLKCAHSSSGENPAQIQKRYRRNRELLVAKGLAQDALEQLDSEESDYRAQGLAIHYVKGSGLPVGVLQVGDLQMAIDDHLDPQAEAREWARTLKIRSDDAVVTVVGFGFGYAAEAVLRLLGPKGRLIVIETYASLLRAAMEHRDLRSLLSDARFTLKLSPTEEELRDWMVEHFKLYPVARKFVPGVRSAYAALMGVDALQLTKVAMAAFDAQVRRLMTMRQSGETWTKQMLPNVHWEVSYPGMEAWDELGSMPAAIVVGAGPSLDGALEFLRRMQHRVPIFAADSAIPRLVANGIDAHIALAIDCKEAPMRSAAKLNPEKTGLIVGDHVHIGYKDLPSLFKITCVDEDWCEIFKPVYKRKTWRHMTFVGGTAAHVARMMGARKIYLVGCDFAFAPDGSTHVKDALPAELMAKHSNDSWLPVPGYTHPELNTSHTLKHYLDEFVDFVNKFKELEVIPVTDGGARIGSLQHVLPDEALKIVEQYPERDWRCVFKNCVDLAQQKLNLQAQRRLIYANAAALEKFHQRLKNADSRKAAENAIRDLTNHDCNVVTRLAMQHVIDQYRMTGRITPDSVERFKEEFEKLMPTIREVLELEYLDRKPAVAGGSSSTSNVNEALSIETIVKPGAKGTGSSCAILTPVGPGHARLYEFCSNSIKSAFEVQPGNFERIHLLRIDDTKGALGRSYARNLGVQAAAKLGAEWIFFLDADDLLAPEAFASAAPWLDAHDAVWGAIYSFIDGQGKPEPREGQIQVLRSLDDVLKDDPYLTLQMGHFVKTKVALENPFNEKLDAGEDFDYYLRVWDKYRCIKFPLPLFYNRRGAHSQGPRSADGGKWRIEVTRIIDRYRQREKCMTTVVSDPNSQARQVAEKPFIFVAAMPRSGSTLLAGMLTCEHKSIVLSEPGFQRGMHHNLEQFHKIDGVRIEQLERYAGKPQQMLQGFKQEILPQLLKSYPQVGVKECFIDNWSLYPQLFPNIRMIVLARDPRDVMLSIIEYGEHAEWHRRMWADRPDEYIAERHNTIWAQQKQILNSNLPVLKLRYEDLCQGLVPFSTLKSFCELDFAAPEQCSQAIASHAWRSWEIQKHGDRISDKTVYRWRNEKDPKRRERAQNLARLMQDYCRFWGYLE